MDHKVKIITGFKTLSVMLIIVALLLGGCVTYKKTDTQKVAEPPMS